MHAFFLDKEIKVVMVMYQSMLSVTIPMGQPQENFQKLPYPDPFANFCQIPGSQASLGHFYFNKLYTFSPFSRLYSLIYPLNIYKFAGITWIYQ